MLQRTKMPLGDNIWHVGDPARIHGACEMYVHVPESGDFCQVLMQCIEFYDGTVLVRTRESVELAYASCIDAYDAHHVSNVTWDSGDTIEGLWNGGVAELHAAPYDEDHTRWFDMEDAFVRAERCAGLLAVCRLFGRMGREFSTASDFIEDCLCS